MFFIGIFGIEQKEKRIKEADSFLCKECSSEGTGQIMKSYNYFHFFFIPLFKWDERYYVTCDICSTIFELSREKGKRIEKGSNEGITYWDIKDAYKVNQSKICSICRNKVENEFTYCPHCGNKLK